MVLIKGRSHLLNCRNCRAFLLKHQINYSENQAKEMFCSTANQGKNKPSPFPKQREGREANSLFLKAWVRISRRKFLCPGTHRREWAIGLQVDITGLDNDRTQTRVLLQVIRAGLISSAASLMTTKVCWFYFLLSMRVTPNLIWFRKIKQCDTSCTWMYRRHLHSRRQEPRLLQD